MMPLQWMSREPASEADEVQARLLPDAILAVGAGSPAVRVQSGWSRRPADVYALTRVGAEVPRLPRGRGVAVPSVSMREKLVARAPHLGSRVAVLPFPVPEAMFDWDDARAVAEVNFRYHLEARPRIVATADWERGQGLSRLLPLATAVLHREGELVLVGALSHRSRIAPLLTHLGLVQTVVLLPRLTAREAAGLMHSADVFVQADVSAGYPFWLLWAQAAGLPSVTVDDRVAREASGHAAVVVEEGRREAWALAVGEVMNNLRLRETQIARGREHAAGFRLSQTAAVWARELAARWWA